MPGLLKLSATLSPRRSVPNGRLAIDWAHPIARGLVGFWVPGVTGGIDLTGNCSVLKQVSSATKNYLTVNKEGPVLSGGNSGDCNVMGALAPDIYKTFSELTLFVRLSPLERTGAAQQYPIYLSHTDGVNGPYLSAAISGAFVGSSYGFEYSTNTTGDTSLTGGVSGTAGGSIVMTAVVGGAIKCYDRGVQTATGTWAGTGLKTMTPTDRISLQGWEAFAGDRVVAQDLYVAGIWNRAVSSDEAMLLEQDPYCFLLPVEKEMPVIFLPVGGTGATAPGSTVGSAGSVLAGAASGTINATATGATIVLGASVLSGAASGQKNASAFGSILVSPAAIAISGTATGQINATASGATIVSAASVAASGTATGQRNATAAGVVVPAAGSIIAGSASAAANATANGSTVSTAASLLAGSATGAGAGMALGSVLVAASSVVAGVATGQRNVIAAGATVPVAGSVIAGAASAGSASAAPGATIIASVQILSGSATGGQFAQGAILSRPVSIIQGTARGDASAQGVVIQFGASLIWPSVRARRPSYGFHSPPSGPCRPPNLSTSVRHGT